MDTLHPQHLDRLAAIQASLAAAADYEPLTRETSANASLVDSEDAEDIVIEIERLITLGVASSDINKLKGAGIITVAGAAMTSKKVRNFRSP